MLRATLEAALVIFVMNPAKAGEGTILDQSKLSGNWGGLRDSWEKQGFTIEGNLTQFYQGVHKGGSDRGYEYGGKFDIYLSYDGDKSGLLPGFSAITHIETRYGEDVNEMAGLFALPNFNMGFPKADEDGVGITAFKLTQRLCDNFLLIAGKINTLDDFRLNYTGKNGLERFMNSAIVANVINGRTIPYSTYGAGFAVFSEGGPEFTFLARDPDNHPTTADLDELFDNGVLLTATFRLPVAPFGLRGEQVFGANWSSRNYTSLEPSPTENIPGQGLPAPEQSDSWALWYNFDQTLWTNRENTNQSFGLFVMSGISDGNPNPVRWNVTAGLGASGLFPTRDYDTMGLAYYHIGISQEMKDLLATQPGLSQRDERGFELYYNARLTPWCHLTADIQTVEPSTKDLDRTVTAGLRLGIEF